MNTTEAVLAHAEALDGRISLAARDLRSGRTILFHPDRKCPTASVIKLPILVHTLLLVREGKLSLDAPVVLRPGDARPGSGILKDLKPGLRLTLHDACMLMIAVSDNTATNLVLDVVGIEPVNQRMASLGCRNTKLFRKVFSPGPPVSRENARYGLGVTTPRDMLRLLTAIYRGAVGGPETSAQVRSYLRAQQGRDGIPRLLPSTWEYEGKGGAIETARNDVGYVIGPDGTAIALAIFCIDLKANIWTADNPGWLAIAGVASDVCRAFGHHVSSPEARHPSFPGRGG